MIFKSRGLTRVTVAMLIVFTLFGTSVFGTNKIGAASSWSEEYDAAQGTLYNVSTENSESGYTGNGYVAGWNKDGQAVEINVNVPSDGIYTLVFRYSAAAGQATRYLTINGESAADEVRFSGTGSWGDWQTVSVNHVSLIEGTNTVSLIFDSSKASTNWLNYDSLLVKEQEEDESFEWGLKSEQAEQAQDSLNENFWNTGTNMFNNQFPDNESNDQFHYWWQAHAIDTLIDGYERTGNDGYINQATALYEAVLKRNGGHITNDFYDDMSWMALALQRLHEYTKDDNHEKAVFTLWEDIKTGWSNEQGGGIAWNKHQLDYKNTPSNAPAVILAARLYEKYGNEADLQWAHDIYNWQKETLVDPITGLVWDGINRTGDGSIDKGWEFSYNQGVFIGASVELYRITGEKNYLNDAIKTAETTKKRFSNHNQIIYEGGSKDGGLFKGILIRYLTELINEDPSQDQLAQWILYNANSVWNQMDSKEEILFGGSWEGKQNKPVELSQQLSGVMLMEHAAQLEKSIIENIHLSLNQQLETYVTEGEVKGPLVSILKNQLQQVQHHLNNGSLLQAVKHLQDFSKHLNNKVHQDYLTEGAKQELDTSLEMVISSDFN